MIETDLSKRTSVQWLRWMPNWLEFALVIGITLCPFIYSSLAMLFSAPPDGAITDQGLQWLAITEAMTLLLVVPLMYARGWTSAHLGLKFERRDIFSALILLIASYAGFYATLIVFEVAMPDKIHAASETRLAGSAFEFGTVIAASTANGFFEELFVAGYLIQSLRTRFGVIAGINASILVRLSYHLYQGAIGVVNIVPFGLIFAWVFVRTGRLWPLIVAHVLADIISLGLS